MTPPSTPRSIKTACCHYESMQGCECLRAGAPAMGFAVRPRCWGCCPIARWAELGGAELRSETVPWGGGDYAEASRLGYCYPVMHDVFSGGQSLWHATGGKACFSNGSASYTDISHYLDIQGDGFTKSLTKERHLHILAPTAKPGWIQKPIWTSTQRRMIMDIYSDWKKRSVS